MDQRLSPACWSFSSRRLDYDRVSAARSGNVRDVANNAARTRSAATEASSTNDGAAAEEAAQAVMQISRRQHCYGCVLAWRWT